MGFEKISNQSEGFLLNSLEPGQHKDFYIEGVVKDVNKQYGTDTVNFTGYDPETGNPIKILTGGTAKYDAQNIAAAQGILQAKDPRHLEDGKEKMKILGYLCRFTRVSSYTQKKGGKEVKTFNIERDTDKPLEAFLALKNAT